MVCAWHPKAGSQQPGEPAWVVVAKSLVFAPDGLVSKSRLTVSFSSSWLRVGFEPSAFLGMGNTVDTGRRRTLPSWSSHLSGEATKKSLFGY